jgi:TonB family protein
MTLSVNHRHWQSFAMAFGLESLLIGSTLIWAGQHIAPISKVIPLTLEMAVEPLREKVPERAEPPKNKTYPPPKPQVNTNLQPVSPSAPKVQSVSNDASVSAASKTETPAATAPSTPTLASASPATQPAPDPALAYNIKLAAAVQAAFEVPGTAKALSFKGRTRMEFSLHDGKVTAIRVIQSSGLSAVDRAATKAVESASYPLPPAGLQNKEGVYQIWVACY